MHAVFTGEIAVFTGEITVGYSIGTSPLVLAFPYVGTEVASPMLRRLSAAGKSLSEWQSAFCVPYHATLKAHVVRVRAQHGHAIVVDCVVQRDRCDAPKAEYDVAVATKSGVLCATGLASDFVNFPKNFGTQKAGIDNRFGTGWPVETCGQPKAGIHALQIQISADAFLASLEEPWPYEKTEAALLRALPTEALADQCSWQPVRIGASTGIYRTG